MNLDAVRQHENKDKQNKTKLCNDIKITAFTDFGHVVLIYVARNFHTSSVLSIHLREFRLPYVVIYLTCY
jgi:hypothetical protein